MYEESVASLNRSTMNPDASPFNAVNRQSEFADKLTSDEQIEFENRVATHGRGPGRQLDMPQQNASLTQQLWTYEMLSTP